MATQTNVEVLVEIPLDNAIRRGETLIGTRYENQYQTDFIKANYTKIGVGLCQTKQKYIDIYQDKNGHIYGVSTVLPYRYFELNHSGK